MCVELVVYDDVKAKQLKTTWIIRYFVLTTDQCLQGNVFYFEPNRIIVYLHAVEVFS